MRSSFFLALVASMALAFGADIARAAPALPANAAQELLDMDRQFSSDGADKNIVDAIAAMLAPNAISPAPGGTFAKSKDAIADLLRASPANANATAEWAPVRAGVSADGQHGFTYGFMTIHIPGEADRRAKYLSYWIKRPEGWRVSAYKRAASPPGAVSTAVRAPALPPRMIPDRPSLALGNKYRTSLAERESAFSARAQEIGLGSAFVEFGSGGAMNMGPGSDFAYGNTAIGAGLPNDVPPGLTWGPDEHVIVASTGDLGVTFGYIRISGGPTIPFFTVWRRNAANDPWLYVAE